MMIDQWWMTKADMTWCRWIHSMLFTIRWCVFWCLRDFLLLDFSMFKKTEKMGNHAACEATKTHMTITSTSSRFFHVVMSTSIVPSSSLPLFLLVFFVSCHPLPACRLLLACDCVPSWRCSIKDFLIACCCIAGLMPKKKQVSRL